MRLAAAARFLAAQKALIIDRSSSSEDARSTVLSEQDLLLKQQQQRSVGVLVRNQRTQQHGENQPHDLFAKDDHPGNTWNSEKVLRNDKVKNNNPQQQLCDPHSAEPDIGILSCGTLYYCAESQDSVLGGICTPAVAYTTSSSSRHLQEDGSDNYCSYPEEYNCDCTNFDLTTNVGSFECQLYTDYCCELNGTPICAGVTVAGENTADSNSTTFCYDFTSPDVISFCATFTGTAECTIAVDGVECNSCQVLDCSDIEFAYGFDCTNIAASGRVGGCDDVVLPITDDLISDACVRVGANETIPPMDNMTTIVPSTLGTTDNMTAPTMTPSSVNGTGLPLEPPTPVPSGSGTNVTMTTDFPTMAPGMNTTAPPTGMATMTATNATEPTVAPDNNDTSATEPPTMAPIVSPVADAPVPTPSPVAAPISDAAVFHGAGLAIASVAVTVTAVAVGLSY